MILVSIIKVHGLSGQQIGFHLITLVSHQIGITGAILLAQEQAFLQALRLMNSI
jgi:hypothetical protein